MAPQHSPIQISRSYGSKTRIPLPGRRNRQWISAGLGQSVCCVAGFKGEELAANLPNRLERFHRQRRRCALGGRLRGHRVLGSRHARPQPGREHHQPSPGGDQLLL